MSSRLQLDVRNLSLGRRHLVNAYEVKAGISVIAGKLCDTCLSVLRVLQKWALYKYTYIYLFLPLAGTRRVSGRMASSSFSARQSTLLNERLLHSYRQNCGRQSASTSIQLTTKSAAYFVSESIRYKHTISNNLSQRTSYCCTYVTLIHVVHKFNVIYERYDTIRYGTVYATCSKTLTDSQLSLPHGMNKNVKEKKRKINWWAW